MLQLLEKLSLDDLGEEQRQLAELIGMGNYRMLVETFGGTAIYVPQQAAFERSLRNEHIREEFQGSNYDELARKYKLTTASIRVIVDDISKRMRSGVCKDQLSIFDV